MNNRLKKMKSWGGLPFDIDFLREIGIEIGQDWDGELIIEYPSDIPQRMRDLIEEFGEEIKKRLHHEGIHARESFVGGPLSGKRYYNWIQPNKPFCYHVKRKEWAIYMVKSHDDPRAWFIGTATSKKNGKLMKINTASRGQEGQE
jgi:hypothetical protein